MQHTVGCLILAAMIQIGWQVSFADWVCLQFVRAPVQVEEPEVGPPVQDQVEFVQ